ncbi:MAG TPA: Gfo/Idh/MocA family oxidoreductase [Dehalococcoidia bacterium]|nr:Gfo/Idh/MocA family oxidoreductase [Dehalococcoidia bacterium]
MAIGWGIIGTGQFAERCIVPGIKGTAGAELRGISSRDLGRARAFAQTHDIPAAYDSVDALLRDDSIQAVWITTPHAAHVDLAIRAAEAGKHVLCEKPLATTVEDARRMVEAAARHGVRLGTGFHLRHHPLVRSARERIAQGEIGDLVMARGEWTLAGSTFPAPWRQDPDLAGGGIVVGTAVHIFDVLRFLTSREILAVTGFTNEQPPERPVDNIIVAALQFAGGAYGAVWASRVSPHAENAIEVQGTKGRLTIHDVVGEGDRRSDLRLNGRIIEVAEAENVKPFVAQVEAFNRSIETGEAPSASGLDGLRIADVTAGLVQASRTGQTARLSD